MSPPRVRCLSADAHDVESIGGVPTEHGDRCDAGVHAAVSWTYVRGERAEESLLRIRQALKAPRGWWDDNDEADYEAIVENQGDLTANPPLVRVVEMLAAVQQVTSPYFGRVESSVIFEGKPMVIYPVGILPDTPEPMRTLCRVYEDIISRGAFAVDVEEVERQLPAAREVILSQPYDEAEFPLCHCGRVSGQHSRLTCTGQEGNRCS